MDPYGSYFVQLDADTNRQYTLQPRPINDPYYPLTVTVTSATAGDFIMSEVFFTRTGEKAAYGIAQVAVNRSSVTFTVTNVPPMDAGAYALGVTLPNRGICAASSWTRFSPLPARTVNVHFRGAVATTGGFDVGASPRRLRWKRGQNALTRAPLGRIRMWNSPQTCSGNRAWTLSMKRLPTSRKYSFYNVVSTAAQYNLAAQSPAANGPAAA